MTTKMNNIKLGYDDVSIVPAVISTIKSRKECNTCDEFGRLPIFVSPMDTVISEDNYDDFARNSLNIVVPRTVNLVKRIQMLFQINNFVAFSLAEAKDLFVDDNLEKYVFYDTIKNGWGCKICIDLANGHMKDLLDTVKSIKMKHPEIIIMTGNIANPKTYVEYEKARVDYVRIGIGGGAGCLTASNTGTYMPYFSLLKEIHEERKKIDGKCKVIADGGIKGYRDIQKALIYADYVMIGSLFNKAFESAGKTTYGKFYWNLRGYKIFRPLKTLLNYGKELDRSKFDELKERWKKGEFVVWKQYRGMSTKAAQTAIAEANGLTDIKLKTSEGLVKYQKVEYTIDGWVENEVDYLKSAMSYTNSRTLEEYKDSEWVQVMSISHNK